MTEHIQDLIRGVFSFTGDKRRHAVRVLLDAMSEEGYFPPLAKVDRLITNANSRKVEALFSCGTKDEKWRLIVEDETIWSLNGELTNWKRWEWGGEKKLIFKVEITKVVAFLK